MENGKSGAPQECGWLHRMKNAVRRCRPLYRILVSFRMWLHAGGSSLRFKAKKYLPSAQELDRQRNTSFATPLRFSVVVPLYNTPIEYLKEMIASVQAQSYADWELCLADGSDDTHQQVGELCRELAREDARIRYQKLAENKGISGNTNACLDMAAGDYVVLLDHDDLLAADALYENRRAIEERGADFLYSDEAKFMRDPAHAFDPYFKPDFAVDNLRANNYICHLTVFKRSLLEKTGGFRSAFDGAQDYDLILRLTEQAEQIVHIPRPLYFWRVHPQSTAMTTAAKDYTTDAGIRAVQAQLDRCDIGGKVEMSAVPTIHRIRYELTAHPLVSILIPNMDHVEDLRKCVESIREKTTYDRYEIVIVENNSRLPETFAYYRSLEAEPNIKVETIHPDRFNFSLLNNFGASKAAGEYLLLLNNDIEILTPAWIEEMLMYAQRGDVGAVGAKLYYPDDTIQHAGVLVGMGGVAGHCYRRQPRSSTGYMNRTVYAGEFSAVTAACMMVPRRVWDEVGGLDEGLEVAFNDVDLCMKIRARGYLIVMTPFAELYHYESVSRGYEDTEEKEQRFAGEINRFKTRWEKELAAGDPYFNKNLDFRRDQVSYKK